MRKVLFLFLFVVFFSCEKEEEPDLPVIAIATFQVENKLDYPIYSITIFERNSSDELVGFVDITKILANSKSEKLNVISGTKFQVAFSKSDGLFGGVFYTPYFNRSTEANTILSIDEGNYGDITDY